jgi:hypothetical protein
MHEIELKLGRVNSELLDQQLRQALGAVYAGLSTRRQVVLLYLTVAATPAEMEQAERIARQHDPAQLSPRQQQEQLLEGQRAAQITLNQQDFTHQSPALQALVAKIAWLEAEIRALRGL